MLIRASPSYNLSGQHHEKENFHPVYQCVGEEARTRKGVVLLFRVNKKKKEMKILKAGVHLLGMSTCSVRMPGCLLPAPSPSFLA